MRNSQAAAAHITKMLCSPEICHGTARLPPVHFLQPLWALEFTTHNLGFLKFRFLRSALALMVLYDQINPLGSHALPTSFLKIPCIHQYISGSEKPWGPQISEESITRTQKKDFFPGPEATQSYFIVKGFYSSPEICILQLISSFPASVCYPLPLRSLQLPSAPPPKGVFCGP